MSETTTSLLPLELVGSNARWFATRSCVVRRPDGGSDVRLGGTLIGTFAEGDVVARDLALVALGKDRHVRFGALAEAFGLSSETVR
jgi:hypothetical protein